MAKNVISILQHNHHRAIPERMVQHEHCECGGMDDLQLRVACPVPHSRPHLHSSHPLHLQQLQSSGRARVGHIVHAPHTRDKDVEQWAVVGALTAS